mmetsp:Transcript_43424/g.114573  ORF Transcript_43424/g.114573 Transcript_43424/m.114573 type:complete len:227 (+) Transcript_43424:1736-2416(+)
MTQSLRDCSLRHPRVPECLGHGKQQGHRDHRRVGHPSEHAVSHIVVSKGDNASKTEDDGPDDQHDLSGSPGCHHHNHTNRHVDDKKRLPCVHPHRGHGCLARLRPLQVRGHHRAPVRKVEGDHEPLLGRFRDHVPVGIQQPVRSSVVTSICVVHLQAREHHDAFGLIAVLQVDRDVDVLRRSLGWGYPLSVDVTLTHSGHLGHKVLALHCPDLEPRNDRHEKNEAQ